ncbi:MAG: hypothetical protein JWN76_3572 [Chitinophagaceae bacterium]|nr:hypothetical protein [Chitinophagaceae bacterium]
MSMCLLHSCNSPEVPQETPPWFDVAEADAEAASAAALEYDYLIGLAPPFDLSYVGAIAGSAAFASAAAQGMMRTNTVHLSSNYMLPELFNVKGNPYEIIGKMHNAALKFAYMNRLANDKPVNMDFVDTAFDRALSVSDLGTKQRIIVLNYMDVVFRKKLATNNNYLQKYLSFDKTSLQRTAGADKSEIRLYMDKFKSGFYRLREPGIVGNINYINREIQNVMTGKDELKLKNSKLIYLSVFKHSYYCWNIN